MKQAREPLFTLLYCCFTQLLLLISSTLRTFSCVTEGARACPQTSAASRHFCFAFSFTLLRYSALISFFQSLPPDLCARTPLGLLYSTLLYSAVLQAREPAPRPLLPHATSAATCECFTLLYSALLGFARLYSALLGFTLRRLL